MPLDRQVTPGLRQQDAPPVEFVVENVNRMSGHSRSDCVHLDATEFEVVKHLQHKHCDVQLVLEMMAEPGNDGGGRE